MSGGGATSTKSVPGRNEGPKLHRQVCLKPYHVACANRRMREQGISFSEAVRQAIHEAEKGNSSAGSHRTREIARRIQGQVQRLRRVVAGSGAATDPLDAIEQAARELLD